METQRRKSINNVFADEYKKVCKFADPEKVLRTIGLNRHHLYNITGEKKTSGGNTFDVPANVAVKLGKEFGHYDLLKEIAACAGCRLITPQDAKGLEDLDHHLESLTYISTVLGIAKNRK